MTGFASVIGRDLSTIIYQFPIFRFMDFLLGCNLFYLYKDQKKEEKISYTLLEIFVTIIVLVTFVIGQWQIMLGPINIRGIEIDRWWILTVLNVPSACLTIYWGAIGKGKISQFIKRKSLIYLSQLSKYAFLIHQAVFYFLGVICFHLPIVGGEKFYNTYAKWINLIIGFIITIMLSDVWNKGVYYFTKNKFTISKIKREVKKRKWTYSVINTARSCGEKIYVNEYSSVTHNTVLGNNVHLNGLVVSGDGEAIIGNNFFCGNHVRIFTENHNVEGEYIPYDEKRIYKKVIIEDNVWCGEGVKILPGAIVHEGAIIQAGAVVSGEVPKCSYVGGNPAKPFKMRNLEHYDNLKHEERFFYCN